MDHLRNTLRRYLADEPYRRLTDDELWARFRDHREEGAFRVFLEKTGGIVYALSRSVLGNDAEAEEAFQETFCELFRHRAKLGSYPAAVAWLIETAKNKARMHRRWRLRLTWRERRKAAATPTATVETVCGLAERERREAVVAALAGLPKRERRAVELVYLAGMTHAEAAEALGWSRGTVGTYVQRGLERLRSRLRPMGVVVLAAPAVAPERLLASAEAIWARMTAIGEPVGGWPIPRAKSLAAGLAVCLGVTGGVAWWPLPDPVAAPPVRPEDVPAEALSARNLRVMQTEIAPRLRDILQELVPGDNPVQLVATQAWGSEVEAEFRTAKPAFHQVRPGRLKIRYCAYRRQMFAETTFNPHDEFRPVGRASPGLIELNLGMGVRLNVPFGQKQYAAMEDLIRLLPSDDRAEQHHLERLFGPPGGDLVLPADYRAVCGTDSELFVVTEGEESLYVRRPDGRWKYLGQCPNGSGLTANEENLYCTDWTSVFTLPIDRPNGPWQMISRGFPAKARGMQLSGLHGSPGKLTATFVGSGRQEHWQRRLADSTSEWELILREPPAHSWIVVGNRQYAMFDDRLASRPLDDLSAEWRTEGPSSPHEAWALFRFGGAFYTMRGTAGPIYSRPLAAGPEVGWQIVGRVQEPARDVTEVGGQHDHLTR